MKVALIGGGGSRTPLLYHGLLQRAHSLPGIELVLHDTSDRWLRRVRKVLRGIEEERSDRVPTATTTDLDDALDGADFVLTAIRVGGFDARRWDEDVPHAHGVVGQETVGPGGFGLALRNVPALQTIAAAMHRRCPRAWLVNLTNPAGMATEALRAQLGDRVVGVCDSPTALTRRVARALGLPPGAAHFDYGGINHLGWLTGVWHHGHDLLPGFLASEQVAKIEEVRLVGVERVRAVGAIPNEYLYFYERTNDARANVSRNNSRGAFLAGRRRALADAIDSAPTPTDALNAYAAHLKQRQDTYMTVESGLRRAPTADVFTDASGYHEMALSVIEAIACDRPTVLIVNTGNRGALRFLPDDAVVEVPAVVRTAGVFALASHVPASQQRLVERVKTFDAATLRAIELGSRGAALEALAGHPLVGSRDVAAAIMTSYAEHVPAVRALLGTR